MIDEGTRALHSESRFLRQHQIIHPQMAGMEVIIAGVGMIGGWTAHALSRAVRRVHIFDPGNVELVNTGNQPYSPHHVTMSKVDAFELPNIRPHVRAFPLLSGRGKVITAHDPDLPITGHEVFVSAVDSMSGRAANASWCKDMKLPLFFDGRIRGELAVLAVVTDQRYSEYLEGLPSDDDVEDVPCGMEGSAYVGMHLAARIAATINAWCKGSPIPSLYVYHVGLDQLVTKRFRPMD
jgi:molybdopterin/thiamine biosynthesis adenylyltransferase